MTIARDLQWSADLYYVGEPITEDLPAYYKFDTQLAWTPGNRFELALGVRNAFQREHQEAGNTVERLSERHLREHRPHLVHGFEPHELFDLRP